MEIVIKIPKEFEEEFWKDYFCDTLQRLSVDAHSLAGNYERETAAMLIEAFKDAVVLPAKRGRLIDADLLIKQHRLDNATKYGNKDADQQRNSYDTMMMYEIADMIDDAPTVIEADRR